MSEPIQNQPEPQQQPQDAPPWGDDFDPERAWNLVKNLREDNAKLKSRPVLDEVAQQKLAEYDSWAQASKSELERAQEQIARFQQDAQSWRTRAVSSRVETLASADFADPSDALSAIDPSSYIGVDGEIDETRLKTDLAGVLERKPHWRKTAAEPPGPRVPAPNLAQGSGGTTASANPAETFAALIRGRLTGSQ